MVFLIFFPFLAGGLAYLAGRRPGRGGEAAREEGPGGRLQDAVAGGSAVLEFIVMTVVSYLGISAGAAASLDIPEVCGLGLHFEMDGFR